MSTKGVCLVIASVVCLFQMDDVRLFYVFISCCSLFFLYINNESLQQKEEEPDNRFKCKLRAYKKQQHANDVIEKLVLLGCTC